MDFLDFTTKEIFKRYASIVVGRPISPVFLNILVTSVCDMRCTHCFFTDELDDRPRKKLQMKAEEIDKSNVGNSAFLAYFWAFRFIICNYSDGTNEVVFPLS